MNNNTSSKEIFLSIIIPVYNVEKYLRRCLDSILYQKTNFRYEIIAVDDHSTDHSLKILLDYEKNYDNFHLIKHALNSKLSIARKSGIEKSVGKYIMHIDSDDWIVDDSLQNIRDFIINSNYPDVSVFNYFSEDSFGLRKKINIINELNLNPDRNKIHKYFLGAPWNKIVKKTLLDDIVFGNIGINNGEDLVYSTEIYFKADRIVINNYAFYIYFNNIKSLSKSLNNYKFLSNQVVVLNELTNIFKIYNPIKSKIDFILKYFIKFIFLEIYNYNFFLNNKAKKQIVHFFLHISSNIYLNSKIKYNINRSIKYKPLIFFQLKKYYGLKKTISLLLRLAVVKK